jgi:hypothetical protein
MKKNTPIDGTSLLEEAKTSEHQEAYRTLEKNSNYRIGVGVRLTQPKSPSFFVEILVYLCSGSSNADLAALEKSLACLKELKARNYALTCQDNNCVSCEAAVTASNLIKEYVKVKALMKSSFS